MQLHRRVDDGHAVGRDLSRAVGLLAVGPVDQALGLDTEALDLGLRGTASKGTVLATKAVDTHKAKAASYLGLLQHRMLEPAGLLVLPFGHPYDTYIQQTCQGKAVERQ